MKKRTPLLVGQIILSLFSIVAFSQEKSSVVNRNGRQFVIRSTPQARLNVATPSSVNEILGARNGEDFKLLNDATDISGFRQQKYQQTYLGRTVEYGTVSVSTKAGRVETMSGEIYNVSDKINHTPTLDEKAALGFALKFIGAKRYKWENSTDEAYKRKLEGESATYYPKGELVYIKDYKRSSGPRFNAVVLAYKFDIYAHEPVSRKYVYVDAHSGAILHDNAIIKHAEGTAATRFSGNKTISTTYSNGSYKLRDASRGFGVETYNLNRGSDYNAATDFTDIDNQWTALEFDNGYKDNAALDAHWGAMMTYDFFKTKFNRNSYDNNGAVIRSYVHFWQDYANAFWDGERMTYGDGGNGINPLTSIDICAHEIGHAVCSNTADLVYAYESGALNESLSDIWGATIEHFAAPEKSPWDLGEDINWIIRSMENPNLHDQPDTYQGDMWFTGDWDSGGVHYNSGVMNHWYYILVEGKSGTNDHGVNFNVSGIGFEKAASIVYRMESVYLTSNSQYEDAREAAVNAAIDLYGNNSNEAIQTRAAWDAVGVYDSDSAPSDLASLVNESNVTLNWVDNADGETSFVLERSTNSTSDFTVIATLPANTIAYADLNLPDGIYYYRIRAMFNGAPTGYSNTELAMVGDAPFAMQSGTFEICGSTFVDPGGFGPYGGPFYLATTLMPAVAGEKVSVTFSQFDIAWDWLVIYDGETFVGAYTGTDIPPLITATNVEGSLRFEFYADYNYYNAPGWIAQVSCGTVPNTPEQLNAILISSSEISLSWVDTATDESEYRVERSLTGEAYQTIATLPANTQAYSDLAIVQDEIHNYRVRAARNGVVSNASNVATIQVGDPPLKMRNGTVNSCGISFFDSGGKDGEYQDGEYYILTVLPVTPGTPLEVSFSSFALETGYDYLSIYNGPDTSSPAFGWWTGSNSPGTVRADNPSGSLTFVFYSDGSVTYSGWQAKISCIEVSQPENLSAQLSEDNRVILSWTDLSAKETGYAVERSIGGSFQKIALLPPDTETFDDPQLTPGRVHTYRVTAFHESEAATSEVASVLVGDIPILMSNEDFTGCSVGFFDSGGTGQYASFEGYTMTVAPGLSGAKLKVNFTSFSLEDGYDFLYVYDGSDDSAPLVGVFTGESLPPVIIASSDGGQLTFRFSSDASVNYDGWEAQFSCVGSQVNPTIVFNDVIKTFSNGTFDLHAAAYLGANFNYSTVEDNANTAQISLSGTGNRTVKVWKAGTIKLKASISETDSYFAAEQIALLTINKATPAIAFYDLNKNFGDPAFDLSAPCDVNAEPAFAVVDNGENTGQIELHGTSNKTVTIIKSGVVYLKAFVDETDNYNGVEKLARLIVHKVSPALEFNDLTKGFTDPDFELDASSYEGAKITFSLTNDPATGVVEFSGDRNETIHIVQAGVVKLKATVAEDVNHLNREKIITLTINKANQEIHFQEIEEELFAHRSFSVIATATSGLPVDLSVKSGPATLDENILTLTGDEGTVVLQANQGGSVNYNPATMITTSFVVSAFVTDVMDPISGTVSVWPNPAHHSINISAATAIQEITLTDMFGRDVYMAAPGTKDCVVGTNNFSVGVYLIKIVMEKGVINKHIQIVK
jgi:Zn-dependent metalloprotease